MSRPELKKNFAKIGLGTEKIERYDLELVRAKKALSDIEHNKTVYQKS